MVADRSRATFVAIINIQTHLDMPVDVSLHFHLPFFLLYLSFKTHMHEPMFKLAQLNYLFRMQMPLLACTTHITLLGGPQSKIHGV